LATEIIMKFLLATAALSIGATMASAAANSKAPEGNRLLNCRARVLQSEELPFAPEGQWLVNVTLGITPPHGRAYATRLHYRMPWQGPPPRRGQVFRLPCDPAAPNDLHLIGLGRMD
jgi:hypothetical protein